MIGAAVAGCGGSGSTPLTGGAQPNAGNGGQPNQLGTAFIRILMASPDYTSVTGGTPGCCVDVYIDGTRVWQNVSYANFNGKAGGVTTAPFYVTSVLAVPLAPSSHNVQVYPAGAAAGNASQLATVTTSPGSVRTTIVIADKTFGVSGLQIIPFTEPISNSAPGTNDNVIFHHAAPTAGSGTMAIGILKSVGSTFQQVCSGTIGFSNPPSPQSIKTIPFVNSSGAPIGFYAANAQVNFCKAPPSAEFYPATTATPPPPAIPTPAGLGNFNAGVVYPTPAPNPPGQPTPAAFDCSSTLPPSCNGAASSALATLPNLSLYVIDAPPVPPATTPGIGIVGVFDSNQI